MQHSTLLVEYADRFERDTLIAGGEDALGDAKLN